MANPQHPQRIISLSRILPTVRIVNTTGGRHHYTEKACPLGAVQMKRLLLIGALALATSVPALAADLPLPAPAPVAYTPAPPHLYWTGFYIGLNSGGGFGSSNWATPVGSVPRFTADGLMAGGQIGGNYQIGEFVIGAEGDIDWQNLRGGQNTGICAPAAVGGCSTASTWLATVRGRVGYAPQQILYYVTGGGAFTNVKPSTALLPYGGGTEAGWTVGAGIEYAATYNWSVKLEYLYAGFQNATCNAGSCGVLAPAAVSFNENVVRLGVNYKF
jgi:outer membrane immunogenic protein